MQFSPEPGGVHAYRKIHTDLRDISETCAPNPMHQLVKQAGLEDQKGYRKPLGKSSTEHDALANGLQRQFAPQAAHEYG